jgi:acetyl/propionyl-CoA carboxylase alpha subunit
MTVWIEIGGRPRRVELPEVYAGEIACVVDDVAVTVNAVLVRDGVLSLIVGGRQWECALDGDAVVIAGRRFPFTVHDPRALARRGGVAGGEAGPRAVRAPMPGRVVRVLASPGDEVVEQQGVVVLEAMKMQNEMRSPKAGRILRVAVQVGDTVAAGDLLALVE